MTWYYLRNEQKIGPVGQDVLSDLIAGGVVGSHTMVWSEGMPDWSPAGQTALANQFQPSFAAPPPPPVQRAIASPERDWNRDSSKVYPANPPLSPHICWLNILIVGLSQIIQGQVGKGCCIFGGAIVAGIVTGGLSIFIVWPVAIIDSFMVGKALKSGRPVGKWEFFPKGPA